MYESPLSVFHTLISRLIIKRCRKLSSSVPKVSLLHLHIWASQINTSKDSYFTTHTDLIRSLQNSVMSISGSATGFGCVMLAGSFLPPRANMGSFSRGIPRYPHNLTNTP